MEDSSSVYLQDPIYRTTGAGMENARNKLKTIWSPVLLSEAFIVFLIAVISWEKQVIPECSTLFPNKVNVAESRNLFCLQFDFLAC